MSIHKGLLPGPGGGKMNVVPFLFKVTAGISHERFNTEVEEKSEYLGEQLLCNWGAKYLVPKRRCLV